MSLIVEGVRHESGGGRAHSRNRDRQVTRAGHERAGVRAFVRARKVNLKINSWKMGKH